MRRIAVFANWIRQLFMSRRFEREMQHEMNAHIAQQAALNRERGMNAQDAIEAARREFGNVGYLQEQGRDARGTRLVEETLRDVRYGVRALLRTPGFTLVALLSLTFGIGVNTAVFTFMRYLYSPPAISNPSTFVSMPFFLTYPTWKTLATEPNLFQRSVAQASARIAIPVSGRPALEVNVHLVSDGFFALYETRPLIGRLLVDGDGERGSAPAAVLSHAFWQREFGADSAIVGRTLRLSNGSLFTIAGVTAVNFAGPNLRIPDFWAPLAARSLLPTGAGGLPVNWQDDPTVQWLTFAGRLTDGTTIEQARLRVRSLVEHAGNADSSLGVDMALRLTSGEQMGLGRDDIREGALLLAAPLCVLLIGCANVANLVLARGVRRRREIAVRLSLGAGRARIIRQLTTESFILAVAGAVSALVLSVVTLRLMAGSSYVASLLPVGSETLIAQFRLTPGIVLFTFGASFLSAAVCGLLPALRSTRIDLSNATRDQDARTGDGRAGRRLRTALVIGQVAGSLALLTTASVLVRSASNSGVMDLGFDRDHIAIAQIGVSQTGYGGVQLREFAERFEKRLGTIVGDSNVARGSAPMEWRTIARVSANRGETKRVARILASHNYLAVAGIAVTSGRKFSEAEVRDDAPVVVVSESMARLMWASAPALGQRLEIATEASPVARDSTPTVRQFTVIGVAADAELTSIGSAQRALVYLPSNSGDFLVKTADPENVLALMRDAGRIEDANVLLKVASVNTRIREDNRVESAGVIANFAGVLGALALALSMVGIFGLVAYTVSQRTREIGVRLAMGAQRMDVLAMVLRQGLVPVVYGATIGVLLAALATQGMRTMLFGVSWLDPLAYVLATVAVIVAASAACYVPARRAMGIDPIRAIRAE